MYSPAPPPLIRESVSHETYSVKMPNVPEFALTFSGKGEAFGGK